MNSLAWLATLGVAMVAAAGILHAQRPAPGGPRARRTWARAARSAPPPAGRGALRAPAARRAPEARRAPAAWRARAAFNLWAALRMGGASASGSATRLSSTAASSSSSSAGLGGSAVWGLEGAGGRQGRTAADAAPAYSRDSACGRRGQGHREPPRARASALGLHLAAVQLHQVADDGETQAEPPVSACLAGVRLAELLEHVGQELGGDAELRRPRRGCARPSSARSTRTWMQPPRGVNLTALLRRFHTTCWSRVASPRIGGSGEAMVASMRSPWRGRRGPRRPSRRGRRPPGRPSPAESAICRR